MSLDLYGKFLDGPLETETQPSGSVSGGSEYESYVDDISSNYPTVPPRIVKNIIQKESSWNPSASAYSGSKHGMARGLGQFIDETAARYIPDWQDPSDSYRPKKNIEGIYSYLSDLLEKKGSIEGALTSYHGGGTDIFGTRTVDYVADVMGKPAAKQTKQKEIDYDLLLSFLPKDEPTAEPEKPAGDLQPQPPGYQAPSFAERLKPEDKPASLEQPIERTAEIPESPLLPGYDAPVQSTLAVAGTEPEQAIPRITTTPESAQQVAEELFTGEPEVLQPEESAKTEKASLGGTIARTLTQPVRLASHAPGYIIDVGQSIANKVIPKIQQFMSGIDDKTKTHVDQFNEDEFSNFKFIKDKYKNEYFNAKTDAERIEIQKRIITETHNNRVNGAKVYAYKKGLDEDKFLDAVNKMPAGKQYALEIADIAYNNPVAKISKKILEKYPSPQEVFGGGLVDTFKESVSKGFGYIGLTAIENTGNMALFALNAPAGLVTIGFGAAGEKAAELKKKDVEDGKRLLVGATYGAAEAIPEMLGSAAIVGRLKNAFKATAKELGKKAAKEGTGTIVKGTLNGLKEWGIEFAEENVTAIAQKLTDVIAGIDKRPAKTVLAEYIAEIPELAAATLGSGVMGAARTAIESKRAEKKSPEIRPEEVDAISEKMLEGSGVITEKMQLEKRFPGTTQIPVIKKEGKPITGGQKFKRSELTAEEEATPEKPKAESAVEESKEIAEAKKYKSAEEFVGGVISKNEITPIYYKPPKYDQPTRINVEETNKTLPKIKEGTVRLYRAESKTEKAQDFWDDKDFQMPEGATKGDAEFFTTDIQYADYYRETYGKNAKLFYVDIPKNYAHDTKQANEYFVSKQQLTDIWNKANEAKEDVSQRRVGEVEWKEGAKEKKVSEFKPYKPTDEEIAKLEDADETAEEPKPVAEKQEAPKKKTLAEELKEAEEPTKEAPKKAGVEAKKAEGVPKEEIEIKPVKDLTYPELRKEGKRLGAFMPVDTRGNLKIPEKDLRKSVEILRGMETKQKPKGQPLKDFGYPAKILDKKFIGSKQEKPVFNETFEKLEPGEKYKALTEEKKLIDAHIKKIRSENATIGIAPLNILKNRLTREQKKYTTFQADKAKREQSQVDRYAESGTPDTKLTEQISEDLETVFENFEGKDVTQLNNLLKGKYTEGTIQKAITAIKKGQKDGKPAQDIRKEIGEYLQSGTTPEQVVELATREPAFAEETGDMFKGVLPKSTKTQTEISEALKKKEHVGGKADITGLPIFEGGEGIVGGAEQLELEKMFGKDVKGSESFVKETIKTLEAKSKEAIKRIDDRYKDGVKLKAGVSVEDMVDLSHYGALQIAKGALKFVDWSVNMTTKFGDTIKPHLKKVWEGSKKILTDIGKTLKSETGALDLSGKERKNIEERDIEGVPISMFGDEEKSTAVAYETAKDIWFGGKDVRVLKAQVESRKFQKKIKGALKLKGYGTQAKLADQAIQLYIDTKRKPGDIKKYSEKLNPDQKKILELSQKLPPELKKIADEIDQSYQEIGLEAVSSDVIKNTLDNYVGRIWDLEQKKGRPTAEAMRKFGTKTGHAKKRVFSTILDGWAAGYNLKVTGATNNLQVLKDSIIKTIEDKKFLQSLKAIKTIDGDPLVTTEKKEGYVQIEHPNFTTWEYAGKAEEGKVYGKNFFMDDKGVLFEKRPLYAPKAQAKNLNNILGVSKLKDVRGFKTVTKYNAIVKAWILQSSFFHHLAFVRSYELGTLGKKFDELDPISAYKQGLRAIEAESPIVMQLVKNGLTLALKQDWSEELLQEKTIVGKVLDKTKATKAVKDKVLDLRQQQADFLFGEFGAGLKAKAAMIEYRNLIKKHPNANTDVLAKMAANLINDDFGGLHLQRLGRNPTLQHFFRLFALAPDWTESNIRSMAKTIGAGTKEERALYRKFWAGIAVKSVLLTTAANALLSVGGDDDDGFVKKTKRAWREGGFKWMDVDVTRLYRALGGKSTDRKYFSIAGHFKDPIKFALHPFRSMHHKGSVLYKTFHEVFAGKDWAGRRYTTFTELIGKDSELGKDVKGKTVTWRRGKEGVIGYQKIPSYLISQFKGAQPIQIQNLISHLAGETEGFDALLNSMGIGIRTTYGGEEGLFKKNAKLIAEAKKKHQYYKDNKQMARAAKYKQKNNSLLQMELRRSTTESDIRSYRKLRDNAEAEGRKEAVKNYDKKIEDSVAKFNKIFYKKVGK